MVLHAGPLEDDKPKAPKTGTVPGENVTDEAVGKPLPPSGNGEGNPAVDALPAVPMPPNLERQVPSGKPQFVIVDDNDDDDNNNNKKGLGLADGRIKSLAGSLAFPDGGMTLDERQRLIKMSGDQIIKDTLPEEKRRKALLPAGQKDPENAETSTADRLNQAIQALDPNRILGSFSPAQLKTLDAARTEKIAKGTKFEIVSDKDPADGTTTKSYRLTQINLDEKGKETIHTKRMFQASFDEHGQVIKPADFIASKLKDGKISDKERELITSTFQAEYRDNAELSRGGLALGAEFQSKFISKVQEKLKALNPNLEIVPVASTVKDSTGAISRTAYAYNLRDKTNNTITPLIDAELDLDHRDNDLETSRYYAEQLNQGNLPANDLRDLKSALSSAFRRGGMDAVMKTTKSINEQSEKLANEGKTKPGSKPTVLDIGTVDDKTDGTTIMTVQLRNGDNAKRLCQISFDKEHQELEPAEFIGLKLADGKVTAPEKELIEQTLAAAYEENASNPYQFAFGAAFQSKLMKDIQSRLREMTAAPDANPGADANPPANANPVLDLRGKSDNNAAYSHEIRNLKSGEVIPLKDIQLKHLEQKDPDVETARLYAQALASGSPPKDILEKLGTAMTSAYEHYGIEQVAQIQRLINVQAKKLEQPSDWILREGTSALKIADPPFKDAPKTITYDLYNPKTKTTIPRIIDVNISEIIPPGQLPEPA